MSVPMKKCASGYSSETCMVCSDTYKEFKKCGRLGIFPSEPLVSSGVSSYDIYYTYFRLSEVITTELLYPNWLNRALDYTIKQEYVANFRRIDRYHS